MYKGKKYIYKLKQKLIPEKAARAKRDAKCQ